MTPLLKSLVFAGLVTSSCALAINGLRRQAVAYTDPAANGGSMLDSSAGLGEPLNVIISGLSSSSVLSDSGIESWARSISFTNDCLGITLGNVQTANTGDGCGWLNQTALMRYDYGDSIFGSCLEILSGGNHFRCWQQNTTGAYFLAVSYEEGIMDYHDIEANGYDIGRDDLVQAANGTTSFGGVTYTTTAEYVSGLLQAGSDGINHNITIDGLVAVLTVIAS
ncbi:hypothetical protein DL93DRAFT_2084934 [Clavulina sp. PMI_390]|nr:hypothetical protein DL93DRAFT_2084934 [Clavulina sp. PMI_390]